MVIDLLISIHAPLAGSDSLRPQNYDIPVNFNPRSPCGERLASFDHDLMEQAFQSTLPLRGATNAIREEEKALAISIHAPLAGSDDNAKLDLENAPLFQSTLPLRGATIPTASHMI